MFFYYNFFFRFVEYYWFNLLIFFTGSFGVLGFLWVFSCFRVLFCISHLFLLGFGCFASGLVFICCPRFKYLLVSFRGFYIYCFYFCIYDVVSLAPLLFSLGDSFYFVLDLLSFFLFSFVCCLGFGVWGPLFPGIVCFVDGGAFGGCDRFLGCVVVCFVLFIALFCAYFLFESCFC
jgi:hypothetical protein